MRVSVRSSMHMNAATHVYAATYARSACICMPGLACIRAAGRGALVCLCTAGTGTMGSRRAGFPTPTTVPSGGMLVSLSPGVPFSLCLLFRWGVRSSLSLLFRLGVRSSLSPLVPTLTFLFQAMLLFLLILLPSSLRAAPLTPVSGACSSLSSLSPNSWSHSQSLSRLSQRQAATLMKSGEGGGLVRDGRRGH